MKKKQQNENTEIQLENIRLDRLTKEYLTEIKKSDADPEASKAAFILFEEVKGKGDYQKREIGVY